MPYYYQRGHYIHALHYHTTADTFVQAVGDAGASAGPLLFAMARRFTDCVYLAQHHGRWPQRAMRSLDERSADRATPCFSMFAISAFDDAVADELISHISFHILPRVLCILMQSVIATSRRGATGYFVATRPLLSQSAHARCRAATSRALGRRKMRGRHCCRQSATIDGPKYAIQPRRGERWRRRLIEIDRRHQHSRASQSNSRPKFHFGAVSRRGCRNTNTATDDEGC